jgi:hypothetical protein
MPLAIFGISNDGLNLAVNLIVLFLVVVWLALIYWTYADARRRMEDPVLITCATIASLVPYLGTIVYTILRPPEYLDDAREREIEIRASELRVRQLAEQACPHCEYPIEKGYLRCPNCRRRVKDPCTNCAKPLDPRWGICPYCETEVPRREPQRQPRQQRTATRRATPRQGEPQPRKQPAGSRQQRPQRAPKRSASQQRTAREEAPAPQEGQQQRAQRPRQQPQQPQSRDAPQRAPRQGGSSRPAAT